MSLPQYTSAHAHYRGFIRFHRSNLGVGNFGGTTLSVPQLHLITEIDSEKNVPLNHLSSNLLIQPQELNRLLKEFEIQGYITRKPLNNKQKTAILTPRGVKYLKEIDLIANSRIEKLFSHAKKNEIRALSDFYNKIADVLKVPYSQPRLSEHPFRYALRRISRGIGLTGKTIFGAPVSSVEWHILDELKTQNILTSIRELSHVIGIKENTARSILLRLTQRGMLRKIEHAHGKHFTLTSEGVKLITLIEKNSLLVFSDALNMSSMNTAVDAYNAIYRGLISHKEASASKTNVRLLTSKKDFNNARRLLVSMLAHEVPLHGYPEKLFPCNDSTFGVFKEKYELTFVLSLTKKLKQPVVDQIAYASDRCAPLEIINTIQELLLTDHVSKKHFLKLDSKIQKFLGL